MKTKKRFFYLCFLGLLIGACDSTESGEADISTSVAATISALTTDIPVTNTATPTNTPMPTDTPTPTSTPEPVVITGPDMAPLLVHEGDLPSNIEAGQIREGAPSLSSYIPTIPELSIEQELTNTELDRRGFVALLVHEDGSEYLDDSQYQSDFNYIGSAFQRSILEPEFVDVGYVGLLVSTPADLSVSYYVRQLAFARCGVIGLITL